MKIISTVYQHVKLRSLDDWLGWKREKESGFTVLDREQSIEEEKNWYTQEQIRQLNADFNYENYEQFYEKEEGEQEKEEVTAFSLEDTISEANMLYQMERKLQPAEPSFSPSVRNRIPDE